MTIRVHTVPVLQDNYTFIIHDDENDVCAVVDPGAYANVEEVLLAKGLSPDVILVTHHHYDHVGGVLELKEEYDCKVLGPGRYASRIPGLNMNVVEGDEIPFGSLVFRVMEMPGHTLDHLVYWLEGAKMVFVGDVLFGTGCGAILEGSPKRMWYNLKRLRKLPDDTLVYCGHEYTTNNILFALSIDPNNLALRERALEVQQLRTNGKPTVPMKLGVEKMSNPFLRADDPLLMASCDLEKPSPAACFASIRGKKDKFVPSKPDVELRVATKEESVAEDEDEVL